MRFSAIAVASLLIAAAAYAVDRSGLQVGDSVPAYNPMHVAGPDKGTPTCPV